MRIGNNDKYKLLKVKIQNSYPYCHLEDSNVPVNTFPTMEGAPWEISNR